MVQNGNSKPFLIAPSLLGSVSQFLVFEEIIFPGLVFWTQYLDLGFWKWNSFSRNSSHSQFPFLLPMPTHLSIVGSHTHTHTHTYQLSALYFWVLTHLALIAECYSPVLIPRSALSGSSLDKLTIPIAFQKWVANYCHSYFLIRPSIYTQHQRKTWKECPLHGVSSLFWSERTSGLIKFLSFRFDKILKQANHPQEIKIWTLKYLL